MKLILISGKAQAGKDTTASFIKYFLEKQDKKVLIIHYADYLKYICKQFYGWNGVKDETGRSLLQNFGNNVRQKNQNFWVDTLINFVDVVQDDFDFVLVPDVRYLNELADKRILNNFETITVRIERPGYDNGLTEEQKNHISETCLDDYSFDVVIQNNGDLAKLSSEAELFCNLLLQVIV